MSTSDDLPIRLNFLPSDLILEIIRIGVENLDEMKLISPRWNTLAREHLSNPARLPVMKQCAWHFDHDRSTKLWINIPSAYDKYYGVHRSKAGYVIAFSPPAVHHRSLESPCILKWTGKDFEQAKQMFKRCSKIEKLVLDVFSNDRFRSLITSVSNAMGAVKVGELIVKGFGFSNEDTQKILDFVRFHNVKNLKLSCFTVNRVPTSGTFFIEAALCSTVQFIQLVKIWARPDLVAIHAEWEKATNWLNRTGQVSATLIVTEELDGFVEMRITVMTANNK